MHIEPVISHIVSEKNVNQCEFIGKTLRELLKNASNAIVAAAEEHADRIQCDQIVTLRTTLYSYDDDFQIFRYSIR